MSLPAALAINECNAKIHVVESSLSLRQRKLLKRPRCTIITQTEEPITYVSRADPAIYCPMLYATNDSSSDNSSEEESIGVWEIRGGDNSFEDDLIAGILAVDGARFLSNKVRQ